MSIHSSRITYDTYWHHTPHLMDTIISTIYSADLQDQIILVIEQQP